MQKLETLHESLKTMLVVDEDAIQTKKAELTESITKEKKAYETQVAKLQAKLNESMEKTQALNRKIDSFKAMELLEAKTKDLPTFEARKMRKRLAGATTVEIEKNFKKILESVQKEVKVDEKEEEVTLEAEIKDIIETEGKKPVKEDDPLKGRVHNGHIAEGEEEEEVTEGEKLAKEDDPLKGRKHNGHIDEKEGTYETMESFKFDKDGDVILESEDIIDANYMKSLCAYAERII